MTAPDQCPEAAVTCDQVTAALGGTRILDSVSFAAPRGGNTAVIGPNGAGKTTLILALLGEIPCTGRITWTGGRRPRSGYVPQRLAVDPGLPLTVLEYLSLAWRRVPLWFGVGRACRARARALLDMVEAGGLERRRLGALSGGELRRVLLASALARDPELLALDEPTAGVDYTGEALFHDLLGRLRRERGFTQITVCHNLAEVRRHATRVVCLNRRVVACGAPDEVLTPAVLARAFVGPDAGSFDAARSAPGPMAAAVPEAAHA